MPLLSFRANTGRCKRRPLCCLLADLQSAWALLLHCRHFAERHGVNIWMSLCQTLGILNKECDAVAKQTDTFPFPMGGFNLHSAVGTTVPAFWASWKDCLWILNERHPEVANMIVTALENHPRAQCLEASLAEATVTGVHGFEQPE